MKKEQKIRELIKETRYLLFKEERQEGKKTKVIHVLNKNSKDQIATIEWYGAWRQYCFMPERFDFDTVWNINCLQEIIEVISQLMNERRIKAIMKPEGE